LPHKVNPSIIVEARTGRWTCLRGFAGPLRNCSGPTRHYRTTCSKCSGQQYSRSIAHQVVVVIVWRDINLREKIMIHVNYIVILVGTIISILFSSPPLLHITSKRCQHS